jgi:hypothetical protein
MGTKDSSSTCTERFASQQETVEEANKKGGAAGAGSLSATTAKAEKAEASSSFSTAFSPQPVPCHRHQSRRPK